MVGAELKNSAVEPREPQLPVLRFSLRYLFWCVTAVCLLLTVLVSTSHSGLTALALLLAVMVMLLHVSGTAIGTRLRAHADERRAWEAAQHDLAGHDSARIVASAPRTGVNEPQSRSPWHEHGRPVERLRLCVVVGAVAGGALGMAILAATIGGRTTVAGMAVGAISLAVVGAWLAFLGASFWTILRKGWRDAVKEHGRDEGPCVRPR